MKKYITPYAKVINVATEGSLLQTSGDPVTLNDEGLDGPALSNRRSIWGDED